MVAHSDAYVTYRRETACCAACLWVAEAQLAEIWVPDSDLGFLCKNWSPGSCSEVLLHNTYLDYSTPHPGTGKEKAKPVTVCLALASKFQLWTRSCLTGNALADGTGWLSMCMCRRQFAVLIWKFRYQNILKKRQNSKFLGVTIRVYELFY